MKSEGKTTFNVITSYKSLPSTDIINTYDAEDDERAGYYLRECLLSIEKNLLKNTHFIFLGKEFVGFVTFSARNLILNFQQKGKQVKPTNVPFVFIDYLSINKYYVDTNLKEELLKYSIKYIKDLKIGCRYILAEIDLNNDLHDIFSETVQLFSNKGFEDLPKGIKKLSTTRTYKNRILKRVRLDLRTDHVWDLIDEE